jgi:hypothetical protein
MTLFRPVPVQRLGLLHDPLLDGLHVIHILLYSSLQHRQPSDSTSSNTFLEFLGEREDSNTRYSLLSSSGMKMSLFFSLPP